MKKQTGQEDEMSWMQIIKKAFKIFRYNWFDIMLFLGEIHFAFSLSLIYLLLCVISETQGDKNIERGSR